MAEARLLLTPADLSRRAALLAARGLSIPTPSDVVCGLFEDDELVATGTLSGNMLQGMAVAPGHDGDGLLAQLVSRLLEIALPVHNNIRVFTRAGSAYAFEGLGFTRVLATASVALLEWRPEVRKTAAFLRAQTIGHATPSAVIVMNANPFTWGHRWLVERAAARESRVYVLVVQEDVSEVPFAVRFRLVSEGLADMPRVRVLPGGPYVISAATFPAYFLRRSDLSAAHAELDARLFASVIAPALYAAVRYVGDEPFCPTTAIYNKVLKAELPPNGVKVVELHRTMRNNVTVSASLVRELISMGRLDLALPLVPPPTAAWLTSAHPQFRANQFNAESVLGDYQKQNNRGYFGGRRWSLTS